MTYVCICEQMGGGAKTLLEIQIIHLDTKKFTEFVIHATKYLFYFQQNSFYFKILFFSVQVILFYKPSSKI
jgi:hypothetical protein